MDTKAGEISSVNKSAGSIVEEFCSETSAHGLGRVLPVKNRTRTIVWSILFMMTVALFSYQLHELICKYGSRPLTTLITVESKAVSFVFCRQNIILTNYTRRLSASITDSVSEYNVNINILYSH